MSLIATLSAANDRHAGAARGYRAATKLVTCANGECAPASPIMSGTVASSANGRLSNRDAAASRGTCDGPILPQATGRAQVTPKGVARLARPRDGKGEG